MTEQNNEIEALADMLLERDEAAIRDHFETLQDDEYEPDDFRQVLALRTNGPDYYLDSIEIFDGMDTTGAAILDLAGADESDFPAFHTQIRPALIRAIQQLQANPAGFQLAAVTLSPDDYYDPEEDEFLAMCEGDGSPQSLQTTRKHWRKLNRANDAWPDL